MLLQTATTINARYFYTCVNLVAGLWVFSSCVSGGVREKGEEQVQSFNYYKDIWILDSMSGRRSSSKNLLLLRYFFLRINTSSINLI